jgi:predicted transcriptional regulator
LWWVFISTRGGEMRIKIIKSLLEEPKNANRLSDSLNVNYRTIEHHMKILSSNNLIMVQGEGYGKVYFPGQILINNIKILREIFKAAGIEEDI